ncbi:MAG TPA: phosphatase domain-containing protein [Arthrobacter sp.]|nr:phosphatase domain-containing protein [Arthrobacter sp.]
MTDATPHMESARARASNRAARLEDAFHDFRERRARKRDYTEAMIAYAGYGSTGWVRVLGRALLTKQPAHHREMQSTGANVRGWRSFTSVPIGEAKVTIILGGITHVVEADRGGVVDAVVKAELAPGWHTVTMQTGQSEPAEAMVFIVAPETRTGIVTDIDDTVMVTALPRPLLAAWNTFVLNEHARMPTPGMAVLLERLSKTHEGAPVIYLSTGAWNVAPTLTRFLTRNLYPAGAMLLTDWGPTRDRWFRSGTQHKRNNLARLAEEFPDIKWLLIGDDGQHDEALYSEFARSHPGHLAAIAIRELSVSEAVLAGGRSKDGNRGQSNTPMVYAPDGAGLAKKLKRLELL